LLRLQARRLEQPEGRAALEEAVRRVRAIALVHDTLSHTLDGPVDFDEVVDHLIAMVGEVAASDAGVLPQRVGSFGSVPADLATPLSMVLTELLQNAIEHGLGGRSGVVEVSATRREHELDVEVSDHGAGLPPEFSLAASRRLGLQIVRTLVEGDLRGHFDLRPRTGGGTLAVVRIPLPSAEGQPPAGGSFAQT
jgi:two-component system, sensor histidine kinase PdtaS